jgi:hypothetical protein
MTTRGLDQMSKVEDDNETKRQKTDRRKGGDDTIAPDEKTPSLRDARRLNLETSDEVNGETTLLHAMAHGFGSATKIEDDGTQIARLRQYTGLLDSLTRRRDVENVEREGKRE